jgi:hypothetical protein
LGPHRSLLRNKATGILHCSLTTSTPEVKNEWKNISTPPYAFMVCIEITLCKSGRTASLIDLSIISFLGVFRFQNTILWHVNSLTAAHLSYFGLKCQFKSQLLSGKTQILIYVYTTLVSPLLTYAAESWTVTKTDERRLSVFERKILRRIYGALRKKGQWGKRHNKESENLYN